MEGSGTFNTERTDWTTACSKDRLKAIFIKEICSWEWWPWGWELGWGGVREGWGGGGRGRFDSSFFRTKIWSPWFCDLQAEQTHLNLFPRADKLATVAVKQTKLCSLLLPTASSGRKLAVFTGLCAKLGKRFTFTTGPSYTNNFAGFTASVTTTTKIVVLNSVKIFCCVHSGMQKSCGCSQLCGKQNSCDGSGDNQEWQPGLDCSTDTAHRQY